MASVSDYLHQFLALLPTGRIPWPRDPGTRLYQLLSGLSVEFARVDDRVIDLRDEADPHTTLELLDEWEEFAGLPDPCSAGLVTTLQERRRALESKLLATGGASEAYFMAICNEMGYEVEIERFRPFICGLSRCGDVLNGAPSVRHTWRVRVIGPRVTLFRTGSSQCGDRLGKISRAEDLECRLHNLKQAHTRLIVAYEGA